MPRHRILACHPVPLPASQPTPPGPTSGGPRQVLRAARSCRGAGLDPGSWLLSLVWKWGCSGHEPGVPSPRPPRSLCINPHPPTPTLNQPIGPVPCPLSRLPGPSLPQLSRRRPGSFAHALRRPRSLSSTIVAPAPPASPDENVAD